MNIYQSTITTPKTVLFVAHDIGGMSALSPLIKVAVIRGFMPFLALDGPAISIFEKSILFDTFTKIDCLPVCDYGIFTVSTNGSLEKLVFAQEKVTKKSMLILEGWGTLGGFFNTECESLNSLAGILCPDPLSKAQIEILWCKTDRITSFNGSLTPCIPSHATHKNNFLFLFGAHESPLQAKLHIHTFNTTVEALSHYALNTKSLLTLSLRPHPGYTSRYIEEYFLNTLERDIPGIKLIDASHPRMSLEEALDPVHYVMSINSTETFKAHFSQRQGILLWYRDAEALGVSDGRMLYTPTIQNMILHHQYMRVCTDEESFLHILSENRISTKFFSYSSHEVFARCEDILLG